MNAHLIYNPVAGPWDARVPLDRIRASLKSHGWRVQLHVTERAGDATGFAREAARAGDDLVLVAGGDGTVNEALNGLVGSETALGVLPVGTGNVLARQLGMPVHPLRQQLHFNEIVSGLVDGTVRDVDVGEANGRYFLCWAGIGLDAQVTVEMEPRPRHAKRLGMLPYVVAAVLVARDFKGFRTWVSLDGRVVRGRSLLVLVSNIQQYCGSFNVAPDGRIDDGLLDVFVFRGLGFKYVVHHMMTLLSRRHLQDPRIVHRQVRHVEVRTETKMPVQMDGDPISGTPVSIRVIPRGLHLLVPPTAPDALFSPGAYDGP
ncbi:MAG: diacylglycerol kinase family lipid kinase [Chloroflexi bacterium]|nr:diacylglycerol kinase family lipid kinase [Chloroflexota bacterium]